MQCLLAATCRGLNAMPSGRARAPTNLYFQFLRSQGIDGLLPFDVIACKRDLIREGQEAANQ